MKSHAIKLLKQYVPSVVSGQKTFELRKNDRDYQVGDELFLEPHDPEDSDWTYHQDVIIRRISYVLHGPQFGLSEGYCILGIVPSEMFELFMRVC